jgi:hypothetical protein
VRQSTIRPRHIRHIREICFDRYDVILNKGNFGLNPAPKLLYYKNCVLCLKVFFLLHVCIRHSLHILTTCFTSAVMSLVSPNTRTLSPSGGAQLSFGPFYEAELAFFLPFLPRAHHTFSRRALPLLYWTSLLFGQPNTCHVFMSSGLLATAWGAIFKQHTLRATT